MHSSTCTLAISSIHISHTLATLELFFLIPIFLIFFFFFSSFWLVGCAQWRPLIWCRWESLPCHVCPIFPPSCIDLGFSWNKLLCLRIKMLSSIICSLFMLYGERTWAYLHTHTYIFTYTPYKHSHKHTHTQSKTHAQTRTSRFFDIMWHSTICRACPIVPAISHQINCNRVSWLYTSSFLAALFFFHCYFYFYSRFLPRREQNASVTILFRKRNKQVTVISEPRPSPERKANVAISHSCVFAHAGALTWSLNAAQYKTKQLLEVDTIVILL